MSGALSASQLPGYEGAIDDNGHRHGFGTQKYKNGDQYSGSWANGKPHGAGVYQYSNGAVYQGTFANGQRHGRGTYTFVAGDVYDGEWREGHRTGKGKLKVLARRGGGESDDDGGGYEYSGGFEDGKKHGVGKLVYDNGDTYEGEFADDARHGQGTLKMASGDCFSGRFEQDTLHGFGNFYSAATDKLFSAFFLKGKVTQQVCQCRGEGDGSAAAAGGVPCKFNRAGVCVKCAMPSLARLLDDQDKAQSAGRLPLSSPASSSAERSASFTQAMPREQPLSATSGDPNVASNLPPATAEAVRRARELLEGRAAFLGVQIGESNGFVRVLDVKPNSTAWQIGLQRGQYILSINDVPVRCSNDVVGICSAMDIAERGVMVVSERSDPPRLVASATEAEAPQVRMPQNAVPLGFFIGGNLHVKEMEFLAKLAAVSRQVSEKTLETLDKMRLREEPVCVPVPFQLQHAQKQQLRSSQVPATVKR